MIVTNLFFHFKATVKKKNRMIIEIKIEKKCLLKRFIFIFLVYTFKRKIFTSFSN